MLSYAINILGTQQKSPIYVNTYTKQMVYGGLLASRKQLPKYITEFERNFVNIVRIVVYLV
jgi:hypothetical protein